jgi:hypothetical protein
MTSDAENDDRARPAQSAEPAGLVLELTLTPGDLIGGFIGRAGEGRRLAFRGWVDLMSAINSLRADTGEPPGRPAKSP